MKFLLQIAIFNQVLISLSSDDVVIRYKRCAARATSLAQKRAGDLLL